MGQWVNEIKKRTESPAAPIGSGRSEKAGKLSLDDLTFIPAQLAKKPVDYFTEKISSKTILGKRASKPLVLDIPIIIAAMSFGALGKASKLALAKASAKAGTATNTGEGGMLLPERKLAKLLIAQYSTARFGVDEQYLKSGDAVEIKIGQGAKPGQGGLLPKEKVTAEIARVRKVKQNEDIHSPAYHPDINSIADLKKKIQWLRKVTEGKPIIIKIAAGNVEKDVSIAVKAGADIIAIDGMEGGTGAAPEVMLHDVGLPTIAAIVRARRTLDKLKAKQDLVVGGGLNKGADFAKALALGADAIMVGFPMLVTMGCIYCKLCYKGQCPVGITTQDPKLEKKLDAQAAEKAANYLLSCTEEIKMVAGAVGKNDIHKLNKSDLVAMDPYIADILRIKDVR